MNCGDHRGEFALRDPGARHGRHGRAARGGRAPTQQAGEGKVAEGG